MDNLYKIATLLILMITSSCEHFRPGWKAPSNFFQENLKEASPDFRQGWEDGCEVGMSAGSNSFNQMFYESNRQDGFKMAYSPDYKLAWGNGFWFCYRTDYIDQKSTPSGSVFKGMN